MPGGLTAAIVGLADAEEFRADMARQHMAELGLAGARRAVDEDVDTSGATAEGTVEQHRNIVTGLAQMGEVGPLEVALPCFAEQ